MAAYDPTLAERPLLAVGDKADLAAERPPRPDGFDLVVSAVDRRGHWTSWSALVGEVVGGRGRTSRPRSRHRRGAAGPRAVHGPARGRAVPASAAAASSAGWPRRTSTTRSRSPALQRRLVRAGVERRLARPGRRRGDEVMIGGTAFEFIPDGGTEAAARMQETEADGDEA